MRIGIDYSMGLANTRTGVGNYCYQLVDALSKIDTENEYILYPFFYNIFNLDYKVPNIKYTGNFKVAFRKNLIPAKMLRDLWFGSMPETIKEFMLGDVDIVHSTTFCAPKFKNKKKKLIVTIYDLTVLTHPECHEEANIKMCTKGINDTVRYADEIIAISEHTKKDLMEILKVPDEMITVTPLAADTSYMPISDSEKLVRVREQYKLPKKFILFVGSLEPRKNVKTLIRAFAGLSEELRKDYYLVIAGAKGWLNSDIPKIVTDLKIEEKVFFTGYIANEDISTVYSLATIFVYPSLYEGFGLPILEAMSCGVPTITSNTSSMPEVAGDAALLINPLDVDELVAALERLLYSDGIQNRMREQGLKRAGEFSWEKCARETLAVYHKVNKKPKRHGC